MSIQAISADRAESAHVLIVGAGAAGLALALDLARRGVRARCLEQAAVLFPGSRGKGVQPRTLEVFDDFGIADAALRAGGRYPQMAAWRDGTLVRAWDMNERRAPSPQRPYAEPLMLPQWRTQELLFARLRELGGDVEFGCRVAALAQDGEGVDVDIVDAGGATRRVRAAYLVAADGGRSTVRRALGIAMRGESVDTHPVLVADVHVDGLDRDHWHVWPQAEGGGALMLCPLPNDERFQLVLRHERPDAVVDTSADGIRQAIAARTHLRAGQVGEVSWASEFHANAALAERMRQGRVFLIGDAAHVHSPAGGQGLNTSVQDAYNLGWKLGQVLLHGADAGLLETYETERLAVARDVLGLSTKLHRNDVATTPGAAEASGAAPWAQPRRGAETLQLDLHYRGGPLAVELRHGLAPDALQAGDRAPDALATAPDGTALRLFDAFRGPHFTLLLVGLDGEAEAPGAAARADVRCVRVDGPQVQAAYGAGAFLVRPDGYVGVAAPTAAQAWATVSRFAGTASLS